MPRSAAAVLAAGITDPQPTTAAPAPLATAAAVAERQSASTQMMLIVMTIALVLAGFTGAAIFRFTRKRTPPHEVQNEWRAPWDSLPEQLGSKSKHSAEAMPKDLDEMPWRRIGRSPIDTSSREADEAVKQITAMLQRLARSVATDGRQLSS